MTPERPSPEHVDLNRRFEEVGADRDSFAAALRRDEERCWQWLTGHRVVAILAEAGSGKTHELRHLPFDVWPANRRFLLRVEALCSGPLDEAHDTAEQAADFRRWLSSDGEGLLLLDAVDEAKLPHSRTAAPLRDALSRVRRALADDLHRVRVVVTCRSSEWMAATEEEPLREFAAAAAAARARHGESQANGDVLAVSFAPLGERAIATLGAAHGAGDGFVAALRETGALDHAVTPLDAIHYADAFASGAGLPRSRRELAGSSVDRRLAERGATWARSRLSPDRAKAGARLLCFGLATAQQRAIVHPGSRAAGLDAASLLAAADPPWREDEVRELLATAVFAPAGQGLVRPYRPEVAAMLAADHLNGLISRGLSEQRLLCEFIRPSFGRDVVGRAHASMMAWLAPLRPTVLRRMIEVAPELIIEDGDPRALAPEDRIDALERHVAAADALPGGFYFELGALRRFADRGIGRDVARLLAGGARGDGLLHLLQIARAGRYPATAPAVLQLASDPFTPSDVRIYAMAALVECGSDEDLRACAECMLAWGPPIMPPGTHRFEREREDDARHRLVRHAYPAAVDAGAALGLLAQIHGKRWSTNAKPLAGALASAPVVDLGLLVARLDALCFPQGDGDRPHAAPPSSDRTPDLFRSLATLVGRAIRERPDLHTALVPVHGRCSRTVRWDRGHGFTPRSRVDDHDQTTPAFRLAIIDAYAAGSVPGPFHRFLNHLLIANPVDGSGGAAEAPPLLERYLAADRAGRRFYAEALSVLARRMTLADGRRWRTRLARAANRHPAGRDDETLAGLAWRPARPAVARVRRWREELPWRLEDAWRRGRFAVRERWGRLTLLVGNIHRLADGRAVGAIVELLSVEGADDLLSLDASTARRRRLGGLAVRGATAHALRHVPTGRGGEYVWADIVAFAGWGYLLADDAPAGRDLSDGAAARVLRVALTSPLPWPAWASELASARPRVFRETVAAAIQAEIPEYRAADERVTPPVLDRVAELEPDLRAIVARDLVGLAGGGWLPGRAAVRALRRIADGDGQALAALRSLARRRTREAAWEGATGRVRDWASIWAASDPGAIAELLELRAGPLWGERGAKAVVDTLEPLLSREHPDGDRLAALTNELLLALSVQLFEAFAPEDDDHREGVRRRDDRRRGEEVRSAVLKLLGERRDDAGRAALETFIAAHVRPNHSRWAESWLASHARDAAEPAPWELARIVGYGAGATRRPESAGELMEAVADGLRDVELDLATSEFDRRAMFRDADEASVRAFLGDALDRAHRHQFAITQETETARAKRTDLRFEMRSDEGPVTVVEIKVLDRWTWSELIDKLTSQLLEQYLLSDRVSHGIYLIVDTGGRPRGEPPAGIADVDSLVGEMRRIVGTDDRFAGRPVEVMRMRIEVPPKRRRSNGAKPGPGKPARAGEGR